MTVGVYVSNGVEKLTFDLLPLLMSLHVSKVLRNICQITLVRAFLY